MWNPVLNMIIEIKNKYVESGRTLSYEYDSKESCIDRWIRELNIEKYKTLFKVIDIVQFNNLVVVKYARTEEIFSYEEEECGYNYQSFWNIENGFYRECRGVVIDVVNEKLVNVPFAKFFNINELPETSMEIVRDKIKIAKSVEFSDKLDGSLEDASYYMGEIVVASSKNLDRSISKQLNSTYVIIENNIGYQNMIKENEDYTFMFEYIGADDIHVVSYDKSKHGLFLTGIRSKIDGSLKPYRKVVEIANKYGVKVTEVYNLSFEEILEERKKYTADEKEGFVLNVDGFMVKIKCEDYLNIHRSLQAKVKGINIIEAYDTDSIDDLLSSIPKTYNSIVFDALKVIREYIEYMSENVEKYYALAPKDDKVEFYRWVNSVPAIFRKYVKLTYENKEVNYVISQRGSTGTTYKKMSEFKKILENRDNV